VGGQARGLGAHRAGKPRGSRRELARRHRPEGSHRPARNAPGSSERQIRAPGARRPRRRARRQVRENGPREAGVFESVKAKVVAAQGRRTASSSAEKRRPASSTPPTRRRRTTSTTPSGCRRSSHPKIVYPMVLVKGANKRSRELHAHNACGVGDAHSWVHSSP
jgi:hypothetical protein